MKHSIVNIIVFCLATGSINAQSVNDNYAKVFKAVVPLVGDISLVNDKSKVIEVVNYYDGLGRERQSVDRALSPSGNDVVKFNGYDGYGKNVISYLPYVSSEGSGSIKSRSRADQIAFYETLYDPEDAATAFTQQVLEHSELARPLIQSAPGAAWQVETGKVIRKEHATNASNEIRLYRLDAGGSVKSFDEFYPPGRLVRTTTIDENGNETSEFLDNDGRVVCKKTNVATGVDAQTYYLYDGFGNLRVVIQPEGVKRVLDKTNSN